MRNKAIKNCEAIFLRSTTKIDKKLIANSSVKFISSLTSGEDHINFQDIENSNIYLSTGRGGNAFAVVEYFLSVLSILIMGNKITPFKSKIGIIGYGRVGKNITNKIKSLRPKKILIYDISNEKICYWSQNSSNEKIHFS